MSILNLNHNGIVLFAEVCPCWMLWRLWECSYQVVWYKILFFENCKFANIWSSNRL